MGARLVSTLRCELILVVVVVVLVLVLVLVLLILTQPDNTHTHKQHEQDNQTTRQQANNRHSKQPAYILQHLFVPLGFTDRHLKVHEMRAKKVHVANELSNKDALLTVARSHIARADPRGGHVSIDRSEMFDVKAWPRRPINSECWVWQEAWRSRWMKEDHTRLLGPLVAYIALPWWVGPKGRSRRKFLQLVDNQVGLSVVCYGETSFQQSSDAAVIGSRDEECILLCREGCHPADTGHRAGRCPVQRVKTGEE